MMNLNETGQLARAAARSLALASTMQKNTALRVVAHSLRVEQAPILEANAIDIAQARQLELAPVLLDRILLTPERLNALAETVERIAELPDPVGEVFDNQTHSQGLQIYKQRVPFGVVAVIYEARPTVTIDAAVICLKAGNAVILRGGRENLYSNAALIALLQQALRQADLPPEAAQLIGDPDRALIRQLLQLDHYIDLLIPRGSTSLNQFCRQHSHIPVIIGGSGVCHMYVDQYADPVSAIPMISNSKVPQPTACNALETLLVHRAIAEQLLPALAEQLLADGVEMRVDEQAWSILDRASIHHERIIRAQARDFGTEFIALILAVRVVDSITEAIDHIAHYSTQHTEAIVTEDAHMADIFVKAVDSSTVLVNASLRFNDAGQFGLGTEIAISNQKLHARGPMALRELTSYKWVVEGSGNIRI